MGWFKNAICVDHNKLWKILKEMGILDYLTWPASWETCMQVKKQQLELDMEQLQSKSWEMLGWKKHKLESRLPGEISITSDTQMTPPLWQKVKKN